MANDDQPLGISIDIGKILSNPTLMAALPHTLTAAFVTAGTFVAAISAWRMVRLVRSGDVTKARDVYRPAVILGVVVMLVAGAGVALTGDQQAKLMFDQQPMKMAAAEGLCESVDGASFWQEVWHVMVPSIRPVLVAITLLLLIWGLNAITIIYTITKGGPANRTLITPIQIFRTAFESFQLNQASALSMMFLGFTIVFVIIYIRVFATAPEERGT